MTTAGLAQCRVLRLLHRAKARARAIAIEKLARVDLGPEVADLYPAELSGGMRKRAGPGPRHRRRSAGDLFDEPTTGLDPSAPD